MPYDEEKFVDGKKSGAWKTYHAAGKLIRVRNY
jgi:antitoxin component YwqK of YwqJK toxin-antitoxin module